MTSTGPAPCSRIPAEMSSQVATRRPSKPTISSPARKPAAAAGVAGSSGVHSRGESATGTTHSDTALTVGVSVGSAGLPYVVRTAPASRTASTTFIAGPPSMMISFFHHGLR